MPLISMQHQHKVVGLYNNKVETDLAEKNRKKLLIRARTPPFEPDIFTTEIAERLGSIRNANTTLNIKKGKIFLGLFLRSLLLSSLVGTNEISAQGYKNSLSIRNRNDVNPLSHENEMVDYLVHDNLMMSYLRDKRGNNCGEIEIEREKINKQKRLPGNMLRRMHETYEEMREKKLGTPSEITKEFLVAILLHLKVYLLWWVQVAALILAL